MGPSWLRKTVVSLFGVACLGIGCAGPPTAIYSTTFPGMDVTGVDRVHVQEYPEADERGKRVGRDIAAVLRSFGVAVSTGPDFERSDETRVIVTYEDRWMWDITMYLIQLTIYVRDVDTGRILAAGGAIRMSLDREDPDYVARELLAPMWGKTP